MWRTMIRALSKSWLVRSGVLPWVVRGGKEMNWRRQLAVLVIVFALGGCAQANTGQAGAQYAPYSQDNGIRPEHSSPPAASVPS
jgi:hypothetical protein